MESARRRWGPAYGPGAAEKTLPCDAGAAGAVSLRKGRLGGWGLDSWVPEGGAPEGLDFWVLGGGVGGGEVGWLGAQTPESLKEGAGT